MTTADITDLNDVKQQLLNAQQRSPLLARPGFLIRRLHQLHCALFTEETRDFGITPVQYSLMTALDERGELDQNSLALDGITHTGHVGTAVTMPPVCAPMFMTPDRLPADCWPISPGERRIGWPTSTISRARNFTA